MTTSSTTIEYSPLVEVDGGSETRAVAFSPDGTYLVSGHKETIRVWRVESGGEGQTAAILETSRPSALCLSVAVSSDNNWIAAGAAMGWIFVWNARTFEKLFAVTVDGYYSNNGVDFSPDEMRLVTATDSGTATVFDIQTRNRVLSLRHGCVVTAAKYSPQGDRIATATPSGIRVWDSNDGRLLADISVTVVPRDHLFVVSSNNQVKEFDASTGSGIFEWTVPQSNTNSCITLLSQGKSIAYSTDHTITFWDPSTHSQLAFIQDPQHIQSVAISSTDRLLAIGGDHGNVSIKVQSRITGSNPSFSSLHPTLQEPEIWIDDTALHSWKNDELSDAKALLTTALDKSRNPDHYVLASRALVRARLQYWDAALADAEMAIDIQPSVIGYIAKSVAYVGKGERHKGYRACDIAFERFHSSHVTFLLLIKAIIVFMAEERDDAISRMDDLIAAVHHNTICYVVQAYMYLLLGNSHMEHSDYEGAIKSFERARAQTRHHKSGSLMIVSLIFGWKFDTLAISIQQRLCEALYAVGRTKDGVDCFHQMTNDLGEEMNLDGELLDWAVAFRQRSFAKLEDLGDVAVEAQRHDEAIMHYTTALSLNSSQGILMKRSKEFIAVGSWKEAINNADQVILLDPLSPLGYRMKYAALLKAGEYDAAADLQSKMAESPDPDIRQHGDQWVSPLSIQATIRKIVQKTIRHMPRVLINTTTGRLHNRTEQVSSFESQPTFKELVSSMTTRINYVRIKHEVRQYFRYVMLSHRWEDNEPLYHQVIHIAVYDLEESPTNDKLQMFCKIAHDAGFNWAWSDTCCIDKSDHFVLQEALVAMFKWYQGSVLMIVYLRGVHPSSPHGALVRSIWNTRAWTLQEYVAAKVIHFYTEDWTLYLNLEAPNHKESLEVISEMEQVTGVSAQQLMALRPGLTGIREKLRLASTRQTTLIEDAAYSLLGIFSVTGISAIYGEGEASLGRLLAHVLTGSGDVSIIAWTGESGSYNSCLPAHITVFKEQATSHLPSPIPDAEMESIISAANTSSFNLDVALELYDRLNELPPPWFVATRMKLPCIAFELPPLTTPYRTRSGRVYRVETDAFGMVEIRTRQDLSRMKPLYLIHPWLDTVLDREHMRSSTFIEDEVAPPSSPNTDNEVILDEELDDTASSFAEPEFSSTPCPTYMPPIDKETRARRLVACLRQPFGALLVTLASTGRRAMDYRRVAADSLITVQFQESVPLVDILDNVRTLDVL